MRPRLSVGKRDGPRSGEPQPVLPETHTSASQAAKGASLPRVVQSHFDWIATGLAFLVGFLLHYVSFHIPG
jgi:hypothetical protein